MTAIKLVTDFDSTACDKNCSTDPSIMVSHYSPLSNEGSRLVKQLLPTYRPQCNHTATRDSMRRGSTKHAMWPSLICGGPLDYGKVWTTKQHLFDSCRAKQLTCPRQQLIGSNRLPLKAWVSKYTYIWSVTNYYFLTPTVLYLTLKRTYGTNKDILYFTHNIMA